MDAHLHDGPLEALAGPWTRLHAGQPGSTPFTSFGWARAWWPHYGGGAQPFVVVVRDGGEVAGLAAFVLRRKGPLRVLEPVGMEPGDYWNVLAAPGRATAVAGVIAAFLRDNAGAWDAWILRCLPPRSPVVGELRRAGLRSLVRPPIASPAVEFGEGGFDGYLGALPGSRRQNLRKHLRRLDAGEVVLKDVTDLDRLPAAVDRWQRFREAQWDAAGRTINPEHVSPRFAAFMRDVLVELIPTGQALLWEFLVAGEVVGSYVNFVDDEAFHWYLGGFDPSVTRLGLGKIAIGHGMRSSAAAGRRRFDFGRGAEPYKYWYAAEDRLLPAQVVASGRPRSLAAVAGARAAIAWRSWRADD